MQSTSNGEKFGSSRSSSGNPTGPQQCFTDHCFWRMAVAAAANSGALEMKRLLGWEQEHQVCRWKQDLNKMTDRKWREDNRNSWDAVDKCNRGRKGTSLKRPVTMPKMIEDKWGAKCTIVGWEKKKRKSVCRGQDLGPGLWVNRYNTIQPRWSWPHLPRLPASPA